ncbi:uncharacterized protein [Fopius arisanus]|uniref:WW domain-containing protein n=1 Tax=Fopius arisanus TaxID=64838 RepID=A0A9R1TWG8_9HYME|nr:PREDICTED: uncharacterized protein LOC105264026 [Fopius arisanus]
MASLSSNFPSFGEPMGDTHGWIQCFSKKYPGVPYFFNLRTSGTTWIRPLGGSVCIPIFIRNKESVESSPSVRKWKSPGWNSPTMISSSEEENDDEMRDQWKINSTQSNCARKDWKSGLPRHLWNSDGNWKGSGGAYEVHSKDNVLENSLEDSGTDGEDKANDSTENHRHPPKPQENQRIKEIVLDSILK